MFFCWRPKAPVFHPTAPFPLHSNFNSTSARISISVTQWIIDFSYNICRTKSSIRAKPGFFSTLYESLLRWVYSAVATGTGWHDFTELTKYWRHPVYVRNIRNLYDVCFRFIANCRLRFKNFYDVWRIQKFENPKKKRLLYLATVKSRVQMIILEPHGHPASESGQESV